jgi:mannose/cellobiose epimerase-like protein (N-acyl-D-glucosamine 2-epimerase family)
MALPRSTYKQVIRRLVDHALQYGIDRINRGVFRDGPDDGPAVMRDKEWWQHTESMVGLMDGYILLKDERYLDVFEKVWEFSE